MDGWDPEDRRAHRRVAGIYLATIVSIGCLSAVYEGPARGFVMALTLAVYTFPGYWYLTLKDIRIGRKRSGRQSD